MGLREWVTRGKSPAARFINRLARVLKGASVPTIPLLHHLLLFERRMRKPAFRWLRSKLYYTPLLRLSVKTAGQGLVLLDDIPKIIGVLEISLGTRVTLEGQQVWVGAGQGQLRSIDIGSDSYLGYGVQLVSGSRIEIGNHVLIANRVIISGYDGHPLDPLARARGNAPPEAAPIEIEDHAWIGSNAIIMKGVRIGRGAVVASGAVVTKSVPELTVVGGNPARVLRQLAEPPGWEADRKGVGSD